MTSTPPSTNTGTSASKFITNNYDRLLAILERNTANVQEPELVTRLRDAIRTIRSGRRA
jgi:hypothetical protein